MLCHIGYRDGAIEVQELTMISALVLCGFGEICLGTKFLYGLLHFADGIILECFMKVSSP